MKAERPLLLLDVDGVLSPFGCPDGYVPIDEGVSCYSPENIARLRRLAEAFDLVWATMWEHVANEVMAPIHELSPLPVVEFDEGGELDMEEHVKLPAIRRFVGERPFVWIDDDIPLGARGWASVRRSPTLLLETTPNVGLTDEITRAAVEFALKLELER